MTETRPSRQELERALLRSDLGGRHRHLLLTLLTHMSWKSRRIESPPSLTELEAETDRCRTWVRNTLFELEELGWITRRPPAPEVAARTHARTGYEVHEPGSPAALRAREARTGPDHKRRRELWAERMAKARAAREAAAEPAAAEAGLEELVPIAAAELAAFNHGNAPPDELAREAVRLILAGRTGIKDPAAYLRHAIRKEPARFLPASLPPAVPRREPGRPDPDAGAKAAADLRRARGWPRPRPAM